MRLSITALPVLLASVAFPQVIVSKPSIRAFGEGVVSIRPDQVRVSVSVTTRGNTAEESASENATKVTAVLAALRTLLGPNADIRTTSYSVTPLYRYAPNVEPVLTGYSTTNTIEVTSADLSVAGKVIDTATQAGATTIAGLRFGLRDAEPSRIQALRMATQQARAHAEAIAQGLNVRLGGVISADEGFSVRSLPTVDSRTATGAGAGSAPTPVESGMIEVHATVTLELEIAGQ